MNLRPPGQKFVASLCDETSRPTDFRPFHSLGPYQLRRVIGADEIDLRMAVAEDVNRLVVVEVDDDLKAVCPEQDDHEDV